MDTYLDEHVLASLKGRLMPPDQRYPDCCCVPRLTEAHLFISEDNFDGTYTDHFVIPILDALRIEHVKISYSKSGVESITVAPQGWRHVVYQLFKLVAMVLLDLESGQPPREYLRVLYRTQDGSEAFLYFSEVESSQRLSRQLQKHKERWALYL